VERDRRLLPLLENGKGLDALTAWLREETNRWGDMTRKIAVEALLKPSLATEAVLLLGRYREASDILDAITELRRI
jgi:hypothetical protein